MNNTKMVCITVVICTLMLSVAISRVDFDVICKAPDACVVEKD
jgi:hypothetical protein